VIGKTVESVEEGERNGACNVGAKRRKRRPRAPPPVPNGLCVAYGLEPIQAPRALHLELVGRELI
jgi:hypothetical protein